ncbi:hypothetical protein HBB16_00230 [Pseudonocardia sp. MCCB 268]|nr:hypothetical protein [Pseudonocardia cytotoxica]
MRPADARGPGSPKGTTLGSAPWLAGWPSSGLPSPRRFACARSSITAPTPSSARRRSRRRGLRVLA